MYDVKHVLGGPDLFASELKALSPREWWDESNEPVALMRVLNNLLDKHLVTVQTIRAAGVAAAGTVTPLIAGYSWGAEFKNALAAVKRANTLDDTRRASERAYDRLHPYMNLAYMDKANAAGSIVRAIESFHSPIIANYGAMDAVQLALRARRGRGADVSKPIADAIRKAAPWRVVGPVIEAAVRE